MLEFARLPLDQRVPYFQEVANRRGLTRLIVEKDFWVCLSLRLLFSTRALADKFVFKGGTSPGISRPTLSKIKAVAAKTPPQFINEENFGGQRYCLKLGLR